MNHIVKYGPGAIFRNREGITKRHMFNIRDGIVKYQMIKMSEYNASWYVNKVEDKELIDLYERLEDLLEL